VASRIGQLADLIENETNGLLCPPGDALALAGTLDCLHRKCEWRKRLGQAGRRTVLGEYTWEKVVRRILGLANLAIPARSYYADARA
jgi:glycosyltransferase involved in cell wall biosynthesis